MTPDLPSVKGTDRAIQSWMDALSGEGLPARRIPAAEQLAQWMGWTDALTLAAVVDAPHEAAAFDRSKPGTSKSPASESMPASSLEIGRERLIAQLETIVADTRADWARDPDPAVIRRGVARAQRMMEEGVARIRAALRRELMGAGSQSPELLQLAHIDAILEQALADRLRSLLGGAAGRLGRLSENSVAMATSAALLQPLMAELELRWQPLVGLNQALQSPRILPA